MFCKNAFLARNNLLNLTNHGYLVYKSPIFRNHKFLSIINSKCSTKSAFCRSNNLSPKMKILLNTVIQEINRGLSSQDKINLPIILSKYGMNLNSYNSEVATLFYNFNQGKDMNLEFVCTDNKLWHCNIPFGKIGNKEQVVFSGIGISKQTAEKNCLLTILLYHKELRGYEPYFSLRKQIPTSINTELTSQKKKKTRRKQTSLNDRSSIGKLVSKNNVSSDQTRLDNRISDEPIASAGLIGETDPSVVKKKILRPIRKLGPRIEVDTLTPKTLESGEVPNIGVPVKMRLGGQVSDRPRNPLVPEVGRQPPSNPVRIPAKMRLGPKVEVDKLSAKTGVPKLKPVEAAKSLVPEISQQPPSNPVRTPAKLRLGPKIEVDELTAKTTVSKLKSIKSAKSLVPEVDRQPPSNPVRIPAKMRLGPKIEVDTLTAKTEVPELKNAKAEKSLVPLKMRLRSHVSDELKLSSAVDKQLREPVKTSTKKIRDDSPIKTNKLAVAGQMKTWISRHISRNPVGPIQNARQIHEKSSEKAVEDEPTNKTKSLPSNVPSIKKLFPLPKQTLNNIFNTVKQPPAISYARVKLTKQIEKWECTYHISWPEDKTFKVLNFTKQEASCSAAWEVLDYLYKNTKITKDGLPVLYNKEDLSVTKKSLPVITFTQEILQRMKKISDLYKKEFAPFVTRTETNTIEGDGQQRSVLEEPNDVSEIRKQRFLGLARYISKEKVKLPISDYKNQFIELLNSNRILIVKGEPGCGKSTRIPQYALEAWACQPSAVTEPCRIAVTQPRRIAAISLAERVAGERDERVGDIAGYQVRFKSNFQQSTGRILFCTTGILLRYFQSDQTLSKFTHVVLDEAHERDVNTDLLMNLLKTALNKNPKLKLIVMSATIDTEMFSRYYALAPVLEVPGFTYPVKVHYLDTCNKLDLTKTEDMVESKIPNLVHADIVKVVQFIHKHRGEGAILVFLPGWEDIKKVKALLPLSSSDMAVYCLHSRLHDDEQWKIFSRPPPGVRKVILSTNIAETSVTIDDVVYVVDVGIRKDQRFDFEKGVDIIDNFWISKSSAKQRAGRAGRVRPGECFRLYTADAHAEFADHSPPEILCTSLTRIVLQAKQIGNDVGASEFMEGLPTPPDAAATQRAVAELTELELLDGGERLTPLGRTLAEFQLEPKLAKVLVNSVIFNCVTPMVDIVTLFSSDINMFSSNLTNKEAIKKAKQKFCDHSDHLSAMKIFEKWLAYVEDGDHMKAQRFCDEMNLVQHKLDTIRKLRSIHFGYLENGLKSTETHSDYYFGFDEFSDNDELIKAVLYSGVGTVLQHRDWDIVKKRLKKDVNVLLTRNNHKATITPESINFKRHKFPTKFILYINETRSNLRRITLVRECSLIPEISVLLFSNKNLIVQDIPRSEFSSQLNSDDQVKIGIDGTSIQLICDKSQAEVVIKCKTALKACYDYYIDRLTQTQYSEANEDADETWKSILREVDLILEKTQSLRG